MKRNVLRTFLVCTLALALLVSRCAFIKTGVSLRHDGHTNRGIEY